MESNQVSLQPEMNVMTTKDSSILDKQPATTVAATTESNQVLLQPEMNVMTTKDSTILDKHPVTTVAMTIGEQSDINARSSESAQSMEIKAAGSKYMSCICKTTCFPVNYKEPMPLHSLQLWRNVVNGAVRL